MLQRSCSVLQRVAVCLKVFSQVTFTHVIVISPPPFDSLPLSLSLSLCLSFSHTRAAPRDPPACSVLQHAAVCVAACCSVLPGAPVCCSMPQRVAACSSVLQRAPACCSAPRNSHCPFAQYVSVYCGVLYSILSVCKRVAVYYSVLQCVEVCKEIHSPS